MPLFGKKDDANKLNAYPWYAPRCWHGMRTGDLFRLLRRHRFRVSPTRWGMVATASAVSVFNSMLYQVQHLRHDRQIDATEISQPPIFLIGHWRCGTTLLHERLVLDEQFTYPDTFACFAPNHFLVSRGLMLWWLKYLLPKKRPMDQMLLGWDRPQEDEFALMVMGLPSAYETLGFPLDVPPGTDLLEVDTWSAADQQRWKAGLLWFIKALTYRDQRPVVLKSPTHTSRIKTLLEVFPEARFVRIVRNPYEVYASTVRLWKSLVDTQALQLPKKLDFEDAVLRGFASMNDTVERQKSLVDPSRFVEIRYEDLVSDAPATMRRIYDQFNLPGFDEYLPKLEEHLHGVAGYKPNRHQLDASTYEVINDRWAKHIELQGYPLQTGATGDAAG